MNNNNVQGWPNVPAAIPEWTFFNELRDHNRDIGRNLDTQVTYRLARRTLLAQLHLMGQTVCQACGGKAHRARDCPTNSRLGMLGASNIEWAKLISIARGRVAIVERNRQSALIDLPVHHKVPIALNRKRLHCQAIR